jgi:virginiamycin B lyase
MAVLLLSLPAIATPQQIAIGEYPVPTADSNPLGIAAGPDGALWFTENGGSRKIGRISPAGVITEYPTTCCNFPTGTRRAETAGSLEPPDLDRSGAGRRAVVYGIRRLR